MNNEGRYHTEIEEGSKLHIGDAEPKRYLPQGKEMTTEPIDIAVFEDETVKREVKGRFVIKRSSIYGISQEARDSLTLGQYEKLMKLKEINTMQKINGGHQFSLPVTVRLVKDKEGRQAIIETDLTAGGKKQLIDLKGANEWDFDQATRDLIVNTITDDVELASRYGVNLNRSENTLRPLDTWCLVRDGETGETKVYILDVGSFVTLDEKPEELEKSSAKIHAALADIKVGPEMKRFPERALPDPDEYEE